MHPAHTRQSSQDSGLGVQVRIIQILSVVLFSLGSRRCGSAPKNKVLSLSVLVRVRLIVKRFSV